MCKGVITINADVSSHQRMSISSLGHWITRALLRHKELVAALILSIHLYIDWYLGLAFSGQVLVFGFILFCYFHRSDLPWTRPRTLWIWLVFLLLALVPAWLANNPKDSLYYYVNVLLSSILFFWLGLLVVRDIASARRFFTMLAFIGTLLAIHTIIQARTGIVLFKTSRYDSSLDELRHFVMGNTGILRVESIFLNPNSNGAFFGFMFFLPLGLFVSSKSYVSKALYLVEMLLMLLALYFTYSTGAWIALGVALIAFLILVGRMGPRIQIGSLLLVLAGVLLIGFRDHLLLLWEHATGPNEFSLRWAVWQTGLRVIQAFPLFGIGLGRYIYIVKSEPYRVPEQIIPVFHPHNSYMEVAALGGIPLALLFLILLGDGCWLALRNWKRAAILDRALLAGGLGLIISLSMNSLGNPGWTLTPLLTVGWLVLGALATPFLAQTQLQTTSHEQAAPVDQEASAEERSAQEPGQEAALPETIEEIPTEEAEVQSPVEQAGEELTADSERMPTQDADTRDSVEQPGGDAEEESEETAASDGAELQHNELLQQGEPEPSNSRGSSDEP